ncbi:uncharacterized protein H6S33_002701 [Morchella sextelata]|uniref:uncharacterized protein n=1 Tax=Morchella sextelata TaxID=1174677 RepID=UPI001D052B45|nr:uncharacterized protein H6S33_002701 [Morchella sextelata]KAH0607667.1 hypothetical protein H6S33_002701 [Morchella sextelata]
MASTQAPPPSSANPRKRGPPGLPVGSGNERKRAKFQDARTIAVQSSNPALRSGELDVNAFIQSREFEIAALQEAMKNSKRASNKRAFQLVPRDMRRRTASHNVKRVPKRLRKRAAHEMHEDNTPTVTARRRKSAGFMRLRLETAKKLKNMSTKRELNAEILSKTPLSRSTINELRRPPRPANKFRKRQREKTWLPTHLWHAKRAKMGVRWRFAVVETPTEKCYRPTHRASQTKGAVAWDQSYFSTVMLRGSEENCKEVIGKRTCEAWIYKAGEYPTGPIAPVTMIWCVPKDVNEHRKIFIRVHPSAFLELWDTLLPLCKDHKTFIEDLRFEIGSIEITGPSATAALLSILKPTTPGSPDSPEGIWPQLHGLTNPSFLPLGSLLAFTISDPRLRLPPRPFIPPPSTTPEEDLLNLSRTWPPDSTLPPSPLFLREARATAVRLQSSQRKIGRRKAAAPPGEYIPALPTDPEIPLLLFASHRQMPVRGVSQAIGSWTLMLPWKWVMPVWYGLMNTSSDIRFGGIDELRQVFFERGEGCFPDDFPGTAAGAEEERRKGAERKEVWEKRPRGKKVVWERVLLGEKRGELGDGFLCDWGWLVGDRKEKVAEKGQVEKSTAETAGIVETVGAADSMDIDPPAPPPAELAHPPEPVPSIEPAPPVEPTPSVGSTHPAEPTPSPTVVPKYWQIPAHLIHPLLTSTDNLSSTLSTLPPATLAAGLFTVKLTSLQRGTPLSRARIYALPKSNPELCAQWKSLLPQSKAKKDSNLKNGKKSIPRAGQEGYPHVPGEEECIGFVTTGNFNLKEGMGIGIGALAFGKVFREGKKGTVGRVVIVRSVGESLGRLARWDVV